MSMVDPAWARAFAEQWFAAWNAADLERILAHYRDDFEMRSPLIIERGIDPGGVLRGKPAVAAYWAGAIAAGPPIRFEPIALFCGIGAVALHYRNVGRGREVIERIELDSQGLGMRAEALYAG